MKKVLILILLVALPSITFGQNNPSTTTTNEDTKTTVETSVEVKETIEVKTKDALTFDAKAQVLNLNHQKSNDLISIKAYKKSLQIKVKEIKSC
jgi:biopolymer transport protein ExbD